MIEEKTKVINENTYVVQQFAARRGLKLKTRLIKLIAPTAFALMGSVGKDKQGNISLDSEANPDMVAKAVSGLVNNLESDSVVELIFALLETTRRNGVEVTGQNGSHFDMIYAANYGELSQALMFVIEVNFGSFFRDLGIGKQSQEPITQEVVTTQRGKK
jgi:hypothetical protein